MGYSGSSDEQLSDLSRPAGSSSSSGQYPGTNVPSKRKQNEVPIDSEEESQEEKSRESSGRTASRSLSGAGAASPSEEHSVSADLADDRDRVFVDGVPVRSSASRPVRQRKPRSRSVPPAQGQAQAEGALDASEGSSGDHGGRCGVEHGGDEAFDEAESGGEAETASQPVWFEEEEEETDGHRDWAVRTEREYRAYMEGRQTIAAELLRQEAIPGKEDSRCSSQDCEGVGIMRCQECTGGRAVCAGCDEKLHPHAHFHHRSMVKEGFWSPLSPTQAMIDGQLTAVAKCFSQPPLSPCAHCKQTAWGPAQASLEKWAVITLEGRFDFHKAAFECRTEDCPCIQIQDGVEALQLGYWVGTVTKVVTLYSNAMLKHWDKMQKHMPGSGLSAFAKVLEETGRELGRVSNSNKHTEGTIVPIALQMVFYGLLKSVGPVEDSVICSYSTVWLSQTHRLTSHPNLHESAQPDSLSIPCLFVFVYILSKCCQTIPDLESVRVTGTESFYSRNCPRNFAHFCSGRHQSLCSKWPPLGTTYNPANIISFTPSSCLGQGHVACILDPCSYRRQFSQR